jgi:hypothetical protein
MSVPSAVPPAPDSVRLALEVLAAQGLSIAAARAALTSMAQERGLPVARCAALVVASLDRRVG